MLHPSLIRRFRTNDRQLQYRRLQNDVYGEILIAGTKSKCGNRYYEVFFTKFGWSHAFTMAKKGDAHEVLFLFFQRDGVPHKMIVDSLKEQTVCVF